MHQDQTNPTDGAESREEVRLRPAPDVRFRAVMGEGIVIRQQAGEVLVLNEVGVRVLQLLSEGQQRESIVATLVGEFEAPEESIRADVDLFSAQLLEAGVLEPEQDSRDSADAPNPGDA